MWQGRMFVAIERAHHGLPDLLFEQSLDLLDDCADDHAGGFLGALRDSPLQRHERANELHVRLNVFERLGLKQQLGKPFALDGIALNDGDHILFEVATDISEPLGQVRRRGTKAG